MNDKQNDPIKKVMNEKKKKLKNDNNQVIFYIL